MFNPGGLHVQLMDCTVTSPSPSLLEFMSVYMCVSSSCVFGYSLTSLDCMCSVCVADLRLALHPTQAPAHLVPAVAHPHSARTPATPPNTAPSVAAAQGTQVCVCVSAQVCQLNLCQLMN